MSLIKRNVVQFMKCMHMSSHCWNIYKICWRKRNFNSKSIWLCRYSLNRDQRLIASLTMHDRHTNTTKLNTLEKQLKRTIIIYIGIPNKTTSIIIIYSKCTQLHRMLAPNKLMSIASTAIIGTYFGVCVSVY